MAVKRGKKRKHKAETGLGTNEQTGHIDSALVEKLGETIERLDQALAAQKSWLTKELAARLAVSPSVLAGSLGPTLERLDRAAHIAFAEKWSREALAAAEEEILEQAEADLRMIAAVRRSQAATQRRLNKPKVDPLAALVLGELEAAKAKVKAKWPHAKKIKTQIVEEIRDQLTRKGHTTVAKRRIARLLS